MATTDKPKRKYLITIIIVVLVLALALILICTFITMFSLEGAGGINSPIYAPTSGPADPMTAVDDILRRAVTGSIAYNAPNAMQLNEVVTIQLLLNPSISEADLGKQIEESGAVTTGTIQVTPLMKAELLAPDGTFIIVPLHDTAEQPISATETTRWQWQVTAKQEGTQRLTLVVYMLVKYDGKDYWREVETYRNDIIVNVTFIQRLQMFDWKWLIGLLLTSSVVPFVWRWIKKRIQSRRPSA